MSNPVVDYDIVLADSFEGLVSRVKDRLENWEPLGPAQYAEKVYWQTLIKRQQWRITIASSDSSKDTEDTLYMPIKDWEWEE